MASLIFKKNELDKRGVLTFSNFTQQKIDKLRSQIAHQKI
jgi:hypothetical protein